MTFAQIFKCGGVATALMLGTTLTALAAPAGKTKPQPAAPWPCMISFDSTLLDPNAPGAPIPTAIQSDGAGPYVDGSQGVGCDVDLASEFWSSGRLFVKLGSRYLLMPGQTAVNVYTSTSSYPTIHVAGSVAYF